MHAKEKTIPLKSFFLKSPLGILALTLLAIVILDRLGTFHNLDRAFFDARSQAWSLQHVPTTNSVLILVDDSSLKEISERGLSRANWPWDRQLFAALIAILHERGAKRIVMDFEFEEPRDAESDDQLAAWAAAFPEVILAGRSEVVAGRLRHVPVFWNEAFRQRFPTIDYAGKIGHVVYQPDLDGVVRSYLGWNSLAARASGVEFNQDRKPAWLRWLGGIERLRASIHVLSAYPFVRAGLEIYDEVDKRKGAYDPGLIAKTLGELNASELIPQATLNSLGVVSNKVVFIGANAKGTFDVKAFPGARLEPGTLAHYTAWANHQAGQRLVSVPAWTAWSINVMLPLAVILGGWRFRKLHLQASLAAGCLAALWLGSMATFDLGFYFGPATAVAGVAVALLGVVGISFWSEEERRREVQQWFGSYVSSEVVDTLLQNPEALALGGERKELTVYFSDLAGFTDMSENMQPEELLGLVNRYLGELSPCILDNGGYLDKYIGDAIMGVFGSPKQLANHAEAACQAALDSRARLAQINESIRAETGFSLYARIGVNSGPMIVGNLGSEQKKNYTVIGDAVNLASRLEGANKEFGTTILLGEQTEARIRGLFVTRPVARLRVKGKIKPIQTHELLARPGNLSPQESEFVRCYNAGYEAFMTRDFGMAQQHFKEAQSLRPEDMLTQLYLDKCGELAKHPPSSEWDGVIKLTSK